MYWEAMLRFPAWYPSRSACKASRFPTAHPHRFLSSMARRPSILHALTASTPCLILTPSPRVNTRLRPLPWAAECLGISIRHRRQRLQLQPCRRRLRSLSSPSNLARPFVVNAGDMDALEAGFRSAGSPSRWTPTGRSPARSRPVLDLAALSASDPERYIDEFDAGVVSTDPASSTFVIQGPHGRQYTVQLSANTEFENNETIANLTTSSIIQVSGSFAPNSQTINADCVGVLSQDGYWAAGLVTYVTPAQGAASSLNMYCAC